MKQFTMSMFSSKEELYKTKAEYWEAIANHWRNIAEDMAERLMDVEEVGYNENCEWYWIGSGELVGYSRSVGFLK